MRRRRSEIAVAALVAAGAAMPAPAVAQQSANEGAIFLLMPVGARAVGMGQAISADRPGTESVWWNPAGLARLEKKELAIHHSQSLIATGDAVSLAFPSPLLGVLTGSINMISFGESEATADSLGATGKILLRSFVYAATYATPIGDRFSAGMTYKVLQFRADCSGSCGAIESLSATSSAVDLGVQYDLGALLPATVAVAVRNLGPQLQVNDRDQADELPQRLQLGLTYRLPQLDRVPREAEVYVSGDLVDDIDRGRPSARVGANVSWRRTFNVRAGYGFEDAEGGGASVGLGVAFGGFVVDIARLFQGFSADAGEAPTFLSLRYLF